MATPQELESTYSFIGRLLADTVLTPYRKNALPLFAMALYLDEEDLASFAVESLTELRRFAARYPQVHIVCGHEIPPAD